MASFYDISDPGPDTDPDPIQGDDQLDDQHFLDTLFDGLEDDRMNQREPGLGGEFDGDDPSIWSHTGQAEEPTEWGSATPPILSSEGAEMLKEIREAELLALRGIHLPTISVPFGVDPATGEILTPDDSIATFQESVAELEAILAEVNNADVPLDPVEQLAELPPELIAAVAAELVDQEGVVEQAVDNLADVSSQSAIEVIVSDIMRFMDRAEQDDIVPGEPWWDDPVKLKRFLGVSWEGFFNDEGGMQRQGFVINNPSWMSPSTKWDDNMPWWLQFDPILPSSRYQWFSGEFGTSMAERLGYEDDDEPVDIDTEDLLYSPEDALSDTIFSALIDFSDQFGGSTAQDSNIASFNIDDESAAEWDDGML